MTDGTDPAAGPVRPETSELFSSWTDPDSGVESHLLEADSLGLGPTETVPSPLPNATTDGRLYWVFSDVTEDSWTLTAIDLESETAHRVASLDRSAPLPAIDPATGTVHVLVDGSLETYTPRLTGGDDGRIERTRSIDAAILEDAVAGLSRSANGDRIGFVVDDGETRRIASIYLPDGEVDIWHSGTVGCDVVQFSPTDPTVILFAREASTTTTTADAWLAREGLGSRPLGPQLPDRHRAYWWRPDGSGLWYVEPGSGVGVLDLEIGHRRIVWEQPVRTAHATHDGETIAAAVVSEDRTAVRVTDGRSTVDVVSPRKYSGDQPWHPHPTFLVGDSYLGYTTFVRDRPTFAVTPLSEL
ncbi:hypothetical protein OB955_12310 [Halobacteria archaeon AArc-m2/3/4]|uniref:Uncharacterized protein n=1 Tax=Natronoglomus mannanivorans TaxID=2979990 RepID=A0AAP2Z080_9EURY|nr:hypothetical protein [Halobacteria archaeon AArc-xg1-1]MCU4973520.1 hypothetical protein [Halobacteria archaeon AArc-m2/3/4]